MVLLSITDEAATYPDELIPMVVKLDIDVVLLGSRSHASAHPFKVANIVCRCRY